MASTPITIVNKLGLHARAAAKFVTLASKFHSEVQLQRGNRTVSGKSIMGVMLLAASKGTELTLIVEGEDENAAIDALIQLVSNKFDESE